MTTSGNGCQGRNHICITSWIEKLHQKTGDASSATRMGSTNVKIVLASLSIARAVAGVNIIAILFTGSVNGMVNSLSRVVSLMWDLFEGDKPEDQLEPKDLPSVSGPSRRSVATWISIGSAIEEVQIALLIEVRRIGRRSRETQRLDLAWQRDHLQGQIDEFTQSALTHLGEGFDADDDPDDLNIDILDDLNDDLADFTETSDAWTNSPELTIISLPSNLGVYHCRCCMAEDLIPLEMSLREGQANDALHNLRIHLCNKAILF
ncbi:hypothetical protein BDR07DRAFT_1487457 [Suillus spraguei]|nr:hypothetical protein BDR07DRAFT_1487457 [Suillus spraguei]